MTGNVVFLGCALAGAGEGSLVNSLAALVAFLLGAVGGGRLADRLGEHRGRMLAAATVIEAALVAGALVVALVGPVQYALIALLALALGMQNATAARCLGVPDLTTSVLTLTLTGLAADSRLVGGDQANPYSKRTGSRLMLNHACVMMPCVGRS